jgi:hypothetical protein
MTIEVELSSEAAARLAAEAQVRGMAPEKYAGKLLQEALTTGTAGTGILTRQELRTMLKEISEGSERLPKLPTSAFSRESFYEDCA